MTRKRGRMTAIDHRANVFGHCHLPRMSLLLVHPWFKRLRGGLNGFDGRATAPSKARCTRRQSSQSKRSGTTHEGGAVDESNALLWLRILSVTSPPKPVLYRPHSSLSVKDFTASKQDPRHIGGRHEVAARAEGAISRHHWHNAAVQHRPAARLPIQSGPPKCPWRK